MRKIAVLALALPLVLAACKDKTEAQPTTAPSGALSVALAPSAPAPSASAAASATADAGAGGRMAHCPSSVTGAKTDIKDSKDGLVVTITAADPTGTEEVRKRAKFLAESAKNMSPDVKHTGGGEGGGTFGKCPVVMRNTLVELKEVPSGVELAVKPKDAKELDWLRRESRDRAKDLGDPNAKEAGQGKMAHCPSAVTGASTTTKDTADGVEVTVSAKDEATTKEIRERAAKLVAAAKLDPKSVSHKGDGSGGGGYGRCPVVLTDTTVESKEVPGGVTFTVKPTKPAGAVTLRKETKDRLQAFTLSAK